MKENQNQCLSALNT